MAFRMRDVSVSTPVAVFVSRHDHCLLDLLWRWRRGELPVEIVQVVSNPPRPGRRCRVVGVPYAQIPMSRETKAAVEQRQLELIAGRVALVVLARYMPILSGDFLRRADAPVINVHRSFLTAFAGAGPYERAKERGVKLIGATAHYATEDLDEGPSSSRTSCGSRIGRPSPSSPAAARTSSARSSPARSPGIARTACSSTTGRRSSSDHP
ncbi:formyltransferase family protein [Pseudonocardia nigra]|uniref:formyltransferase family protein n=1 Tax=Pseudonocardia nigra TaxID=1921578 RepID=UPI0027E2AE91|nr:formyltransferase family protein [Pseudonocardia nigra]